MNKMMILNTDWVRKSIDLFEKLGLPYYICAKLFDLHYKYINFRLKKWFDLAYKNIKYDNKPLKYNKNRNIWIFWWQGYNNMPLIVRKCIRSIKNNTHDHKIVLLTKYNVNRYAKLPSFIYKKFDKGYITFTEFSDILRFNLLKNYGGLWVDSTIYCVNNFPSECFTNDLYTASGGYTKYHSNVSLGKWTSFLFGGNANQQLFVFMNKLLILYWKYKNYLIDYFLTDYALMYAYKHNIGGFRNYDDHIIPHPSIFKLGELLNTQYDSKIYNKLVENTSFFKLTYKKKFKKNKNTFFNVIINKNK